MAWIRVNIEPAPAGGILTMVTFNSSTAIAATRARGFTLRPGSGTFLDAGLAAGAFIGTLVQLSHSGVGGPLQEFLEIDALGVILTAGSTLPIIAWRRFPLGVFVVTAVAGALLAGFGYPVNLALGPIVALYLLAAGRTQQAPWTRTTTLTVVGLLGVTMGATALAKGALPAVELFHIILAAAVAWFAGERTRLVRAQIAELKARVEYAEREAERERRLAAAEERARIARDLHDSAGHAINVIAVRAGAARLRHHQEPDRSLQALEVIEEVARQTAGEIDQIIGTLRQGGQPNGGVEAPLGLASLDTLIAHHAAVGLDVALTHVGTPRQPGRASDQAAYRILQEALTNAARHGAGRATVELAFGDETLELSITNPTPTTGRARFGGGHGLTGMRERAHLLGGDFDAASSNGTFRVHARLPYGGRRT